MTHWHEIFLTIYHTNIRIMSSTKHLQIGQHHKHAFGRRCDLISLVIKLFSSTLVIAIVLQLRDKRGMRIADNDLGGREFCIKFYLFLHSDKSHLHNNI